MMQTDPNKWIDKNGAKWLPKQMSDDHLKNAIRICWSKIADGDESNVWRKWIRVFNEEIEKRTYDTTF